VEGDLVEVVAAVHRDDRVDAHAVAAQVDEELGEAGVAVRRVQWGGAGQGEEAVRHVPAGGPGLAAVELPAAIDLRRLRTDAGQVGAGLRLRHADAEAELTGRDLGREGLLLLLRAEAQQRGGDLAAGDPLGGAGRAPGQQLLRDREALHARAAVTA